MSTEKGRYGRIYNDNNRIISIIKWNFSIVGDYYEQVQYHIQFSNLHRYHEMGDFCADSGNVRSERPMALLL